MADCTSVSQAKNVLEAHLQELADTGAETVGREGYRYPVSVTLETTYFPTKEYGDFALPAGSYQALRVEIGAAEGHNWWCVVFPPLCLGSVTETVEETACTGGFTRAEGALITGETEGYVVKFKAMELWDEFKEWTGRW